MIAIVKVFLGLALGMGSVFLMVLLCTPDHLPLLAVALIAANVGGWALFWATLTTAEEFK